MRPRQATLDIIRRLVAFDTASHLSNLDLIYCVRDYLRSFGVTSHVSIDDEKGKGNLCATIGPADRAGIMLSGHTDTVPAAAHSWSTPPSEAVERDGRLYGRGTCDMKSFLGVVLAAVPKFLERQLQRPLHIALTHDEETDCSGARRFVADLGKMPVRPALCIVGEPTEMQLVCSHKGKRIYRCNVHGCAAHSSAPLKGVNAIELGAEVIVFLKYLGERCRDEGPIDASFDPPYTTIHTGKVYGGSAINVVPAYCSFDFEIRHLPTQNIDELLEAVRTFSESELLPQATSICPDAVIEYKLLSETPALQCLQDPSLIETLRNLTGKQLLHKVSFGTEAGFFQRAGTPTVVCGPGSIEQAHKHDEFISLEQIVLCEKFVDRLAEQLADR